MVLLDHYLRPARSIEGLTAIIRAHCLSLYGDRLCAAFIIGSYATGRYGPTSDVDILVVLDSSDETRPHRVHNFGEPEGYRGAELSPVVYTRGEFLAMPSFVLALLDGRVTVYSRVARGGDEAEELVAAVEGYAREHDVQKRPHKGGAYWHGLPAR